MPRRPAACRTLQTEDAWISTSELQTREQDGIYILVEMAQGGPTASLSARQDWAELAVVAGQAVNAAHKGSATLLWQKTASCQNPSQLAAVHLQTAVEAQAEEVQAAAGQPGVAQAHLGHHCSQVAQQSLAEVARASGDFGRL